MMPITFLKNGEKGIIKRVGGTPEVKKHLENLGFVADTEVQVVNSIAGNLILVVKDVRVALSKELAQKVFI